MRCSLEQQVVRHNTQTTRDVVFISCILLLGVGDNKHSQLTLSTCIVSDSIKRFELLDEPEIIPSNSCMPDFYFSFFVVFVFLIGHNP